MKKVLVTGATGFIGRHCLPLLVQKGFEVHVVSSREREGENENIHHHTLNVSDKNATGALIAQVQPSHLLHFAWYTKHGEFWHSLYNYDWLQASIALFKSFANNGGKRIIGAGTCAEYDWNYGYCSETITPTKPSSTYGVCKNSLRQILERFAEDSGISMSWGRIFHLYGPYEKKQRLVPSVIRSLLKDEKITCKRGSLLRDFLSVEDVASAFTELLCSDVEGTVNIGSGIPISIADMYMRVSELLDKRAFVTFEEQREIPGEPPLLVADTGRLSHEVGWRPKFTLEEGLQNAIQYWKNINTGVYR